MRYELSGQDERDQFRHLPLLEKEPQHHPDCCVSLSTKLLATLLDIIDGLKLDTIRVLSVGCGTALFEALLDTYIVAQNATHISVEGVEVQSALIKYLPDDAIYRTAGTWSLCDRAREVDVLMFIYPRDPYLLKRYLERYCGHLTAVLWLGPTVDWPSFEEVVSSLSDYNVPVEILDCGLVPYEKAFMITKQSR